jgi:hypothetical protein
MCLAFSAFILLSAVVVVGLYGGLQLMAAIGTKIEDRYK